MAMDRQPLLKSLRQAPPRMIPRQPCTGLGARRLPPSSHSRREAPMARSRSILPCHTQQYLVATLAILQPRSLRRSPRMVVFLLQQYLHMHHKTLRTTSPLCMAPIPSHIRRQLLRLLELLTARWQLFHLSHTAQSWVAIFRLLQLHTQPPLQLIALYLWQLSFSTFRLRLRWTWMVPSIILEVRPLRVCLQVLLWVKTAVR